MAKPKQPDKPTNKVETADKKPRAPINHATAKRVEHIKKVRKLRGKGNKSKRKQRLTYQQLEFVNAFLSDPSRNATNAARKAGYKAPDSMGSQLLRNERIKDEIARRTRRSALSQEETLGILAELGTADIGEFFIFDPVTHEPSFDFDGAKKAGKTILLKGITFKLDHLGRKYVSKIEIVDKAPYLQMIAKNLGLLAERVQVDVSIDRTSARQQLADKLLRMLMPQDPIDLPQNGNVPVIRAIDVTEASTQPLDSKDDKAIGEP